MQVRHVVAVPCVAVPVASASNACIKRVGNVLPLLPALRRMPAAALGLSQYLEGTGPCSKTCDKEHTTTALGDSEKSCVQDSPANVQRPAVCQCVKDCAEIPSPIAAEGTRHVFPNSVGWTKLADDTGGLEEKATPFTAEPIAQARDREILTG